MNQIATSFASLVKNNNGVFVSAKQAEFLLSQCDNNEFVSLGSMYGNTFYIVYVCDSMGVVKTVKHANKTGKTCTTWERQDANIYVAEKQAKVERVAAEQAIVNKQIADFQRNNKHIDFVKASMMANVTKAIKGNVTALALANKRAVCLQSVGVN